MKFLRYYFYINVNIYRYFQIYISVPLRSLCTLETFEKPFVQSRNILHFIEGAMTVNFVVIRKTVNTHLIWIQKKIHRKEIKVSQWKIWCRKFDFFSVKKKIAWGIILNLTLGFYFISKWKTLEILEIWLKFNFAWHNQRDFNKFLMSIM